MSDDMVSRIKMVLMDPMRFFEGVKKEKGKRTAFNYFAILAVVATVFGVIVQRVTQKYSFDFLATIFGINLPTPNLTLGSIISGIIAGYIFALIGIFIGSGILHLWLKLFGGKADYTKTFQLSAYSSTPRLLLGWIPFIGIFAMIYGVILLVIGTQKLHGLSRTKSVLIYVIPMIIIGIIMMLLMMGVMYMFHSNPELIDALQAG